MNVTLRVATPTDAGATGEILHGFAQDNDWMPKLHSRAETIAFCGMMIDRGWVTVASADGQVIGFLARAGEDIHSLYLLPSFCGLGIGKQLLDEAKRQSSHLQLHAFEANTGAQRFYLREGFRETARGDGSGNDEQLPDITYVWTRKEP